MFILMLLSLAQYVLKRVQYNNFLTWALKHDAIFQSIVVVVAVAVPVPVSLTVFVAVALAVALAVVVAAVGYNDLFLKD